jgi:hypothetical protein
LSASRLNEQIDSKSFVISSEKDERLWMLKSCQVIHFSRWSFEWWILRENATLIHYFWDDGSTFWREMCETILRT